MDLKTATLTVLLIGRNGLGVGREEATELAERFGAEAGHAMRAVKNHGEWFITSDDALPGTAVWSVGQVADYLHRLERGWQHVLFPGAKFFLRVEESGDPADPFLSVGVRS